MTENAAGATVNHPDHYKFGSVGAPFPGTEIKIAEDGEVLLRGPHVMEGYHNMDGATAETLADGWLHNLFKTSGGKYIAPSAIESQFKAICPYASQFLVVGAKRNYCVALITLDPDQMTDWAAQNGKQGASYADIVGSPEMHKLINGYVDELNARLNRWETIKKFAILDHDLSIESGELTPSMKVKRKIVEQNQKPLIESFYS